jgi:hypothetical protein
MNKLKIIENKPPKITPVKTTTNTFKIKQQPNKTTVLLVK